MIIETERQYEATKEWLERFERSLRYYEIEATHLSPRMLQLMKDAQRSTIADLRAELAEYEARQRGKATA